MGLGPKGKNAIQCYIQIFIDKYGLKILEKILTLKTTKANWYLQKIKVSTEPFLKLMIFLIFHFFFEAESKSTTQIYYDLVRNGYDKFIRPNYLQSPVDVKIDIFMNSFGEIKAGDMSYRFNN